MQNRRIRMLAQQKQRFSSTRLHLQVSFAFTARFPLLFLVCRPLLISPSQNTPSSFNAHTHVAVVSFDQAGNYHHTMDAYSIKFQGKARAKRTPFAFAPVRRRQAPRQPPRQAPAPAAVSRHTEHSVPKPGTSHVGATHFHPMCLTC